MSEGSGLGTTITGYHINGREGDVAALLSIPPDVTQIALLPVGYTTTPSFRRAVRPLVEDITYYERWGQPSWRRVTNSSFVLCVLPAMREIA
jgi:hypothetical protein